MNKKLLIFTSKKNALLLSAFGAICTLLVSITYVLTAPVIEKQAQQDLLNKLNQVLVPGKFDNNPLNNCLNLADRRIFGDDQVHTLYRATLNQQPYALVFQTQTSKGYNGLIKMMVAVDQQGKVQGVRTLQHQETPGLGDKIDLEKSDWVLAFNQMKVESEQDKRWFVKKDSGYFDQFTGATITPRAIVNQLRQSIHYVSLNFDELFSKQNQCVAAPQDAIIEDKSPELNKPTNDQNSDDSETIEQPDTTDANNQEVSND